MRLIPEPKILFCLYLEWLTLDPLKTQIFDLLLRSAISIAASNGYNVNSSSAFRYFGLFNVTYIKLLFSFILAFPKFK